MSKSTRSFKGDIATRFLSSARMTTVIRAWLPQAREACSRGRTTTALTTDAADSASPPDSSRRRWTTPTRDYRIRITLYSGEIAGSRRSLSLPSPAHALRAVPARRRHQPRKLSHAGRAPGHVRRRRRRALRRLGSERRSGQRDAATSTVGTARAIPCACATAASGRFSCPASTAGAQYKYFVLARDGGEQDKCDPYGFFAEVPPKTASIVWPLTNYAWNDAEWMEARAHAPIVLREPVSVYEVHLESWLRGANNEWLSYRELAEKLVEYARAHGLHAPGADARHGASVLAAPGAIRSPAITRPPRASARPTISAISSTAAIRPASA